MKKLTLIALIALCLFACAPKKAKTEEPKTKESKTNQISYILPLPSFSQLYSVVEYVQAKNFDKALEEEFVPGVEVYKKAFGLGVISADAVIATKSRNKTKIKELAADMIDFSKELGIQEDILKMSDQLYELIEKDEWVELGNTLGEYREKVEKALYELGDFDLLFMLQLGGWTEGSNRIAFLLKNTYREEKTNIYSENKGIMNLILGKLNTISDPTLKNENYIKISLENYAKIKELVYSSNTYTIEQIEEFLVMTNNIKNAFK